MDRHKELDKSRIDLSNRKERIECSDPEGLVQRHFEESLRRANISYTLQTAGGKQPQPQQHPPPQTQQPSPPAMHNQLLNQNPPQTPKIFSNYTITTHANSNNISIVSKSNPGVKPTNVPVASVLPQKLSQQQSVIVNHKLYQQQQQQIQQHQLQHKPRPKLQRSWKTQSEPQPTAQNAQHVQIFALPVPKPKISAPAPPIIYGQPTSSPTLPANDVTISRVPPSISYVKPEIIITPSQKQVTITPGPPPAHSHHSMGFSPPIDEQPLNLGVKREPQSSQPFETKKPRLPPVPYKDEFLKPKVVESEKLRNSAAESLLSFNQHAVHFTPHKTPPLAHPSNGKESLSPSHSPTPKHMKKAWIQRSAGTYQPFPAPQQQMKGHCRQNFNFDRQTNYSSETDSATEGEDTPNEDGSISDSSDANSLYKKKQITKQKQKKPIIRRTQEEREMLARYKKTGESFLQYRPCFEIMPRIQKCRECRWVSAKGSSGICCRFYQFRRLKFTNNGFDLIPDGFSDPTNDPNYDELNIWMPDPENPPTLMDIRTSIYLLRKVGDQFCEVWRADNQALEHNISTESRIAWKKIVAGVREMCDVCATTIFNYHWTCGCCGFTVCPDCYRDRKNLVANAWSKNRKERDDYSWLLCHKREPHKIESLILTQIVAGKSLDILEQQIHAVRHIWQIPQFCKCELSLRMISGGDSIYTEIARTLLQEELDTNSDGLDLAALLESQKDDLIEEPPAPPPIESKKKLARTMEKYPNTPHSWLCDGRLLLLEDLSCKRNIKLFQNQWRRGQPVIVSKITDHLNMELWRPESFCKDFGSRTNDLVNCLNGKVVAGRTMKDFWDGFECIEKRLMDGKDRPMLLKLKDWPPGDDFAEMLPERYADLMKSLPMGEYTFRTGQLNLASRLPKFFVPPDLGPKMYNAYGSALHADKGTTNLHLDVSDAVNVMVYVGVSKEDGKSREYIQKAFQAIDEGGCDILMRGRVREKERTPGALWHIFSPKDVPKIRQFLNDVTLKKGGKIHENHDPIHDQTQYLDKKLRQELKKRFNVTGYAIAQCLGDAVFIPAGAPHQVRNLHNCIKVAEDFVSPENIAHCFKLTNEFRSLSESHSNHEDKLQIKNIIYHTVKDAAAYLTFVLNQRITRGGIPASASMSNHVVIPPPVPIIHKPTVTVSDSAKPSIDIVSIKKEEEEVDVINFENLESFSKTDIVIGSCFEDQKLENVPKSSDGDSEIITEIEIPIKMESSNGDDGDEGGGDGGGGSCLLSTMDSSDV
ncbi:KDM3B family protein [Megaselia abdita]